MQAVKPSSSSARQRKVVNEAKTNSKNIVNLYQNIPKSEIGLDQLEECAIQRLKVLRKIETLILRHVPEDLYQTHLKELLVPLNNDSELDNVSHFVLRMAYCGTADFRRWLLTHETALFKFRLTGNGDTISSSLESVVPDAKVVSKQEQENLAPKIIAASRMTPINYTKSKVYTVPFDQALDLVSKRQVFVKGGLAFVPQSKLLSIVTAKFRTMLSHQLVLLSEIPRSEPRLGKFLDNLATSASSIQEQPDYESSGMTSQTVPSYVRHMPLCMVRLQMGLEQDQKLKHWGRLQYGLFLKGAGLSMEDALTYFERMFNVGSDKFKKDYSYNIRHMYGKEGKRTNYPPYSCSKIINSNMPNSGDHHGCPFKHSSPDHLMYMLNKLQISTNDKKAILDLQRKNDYQLACVHHYKATHPGPAMTDVDNLGNHPNAWFDASLKYAKRMEDFSNDNPNDDGNNNGNDSQASMAVST